MSYRHQELKQCPRREMEWIDHRNPYEGYDGSDVEEEDQKEVVHKDNATVADKAKEEKDVQPESNVQLSIDSLFDDEDNNTRKRPRL